MLSSENIQILTFFNKLPDLPVHVVRLATNGGSSTDELQFHRQRTAVPTATNRSSFGDELLTVRRRTLKRWWSIV